MKNLKNLGEILNKKEQQSINGGGCLCEAHWYGRTCNGLGHICCGIGLCLPKGDPRCYA